MKLIFCRLCQHVYSLSYDKHACMCGQTWGYYLHDGLHAVYGGANAVPLGFLNASFVKAVVNQPEENARGVRFEAFVIPTKCDTMTLEE